MPDIQITLNKPRRELALEGWRSFRHAPAIRTAQKIAAVDTNGGQTGASAWQDCAPPKEIWRHPATGAVMVRPSGLRDDLFESTEFSTGKIPASGWRCNSSEWQTIDYSEWGKAPGSFVAWSPALGSKTAFLTPISVSPAMQLFQSQAGSPIVWTHETTAMQLQNQGFGVIFHPFGISYTRGTALAAVGFGGRYVLEITTNGVAKFWIHINQNWFQAASIDYAAGGVKTNVPLQINILPTGTGHLTILISDFSQTTARVLNSSTRTPRMDVAHTIDLRPYFDDIIYSPTEGYWTTLPPAPIVIGCRGRTYNVIWTAYKNIYPTATQQVLLRPENLLQPKEQGGEQIDMLGLMSTQPPADGKPWMRLLPLSPSGIFTWSDEAIMALQLNLRASSLVSPELWGYGISIPETTVTPTWTPIDVSARFLRLIFKRSLDLDPQNADIRLNLDNDPRGIYRLYGPVEITAKGMRVWEGYVSQRRPTIESSAAMVTDQMQCVGIETRLAETPAGFEPIGGFIIKDIFLGLLNKAGFATADVEFGADDGWFDTTTIPQPNGTEQDKAFSADSSVADALRGMAEYYGVQDRSAIMYTYNPATQKWLIQTVPKYNPESPPTVRFHAGEPPVGYEDEDARWAAGQYLISQPIEITVDPPAFNTVRLRVAESTSEDSKGLGVTVRADADSVNNPLANHFTGRVIQQRIESPRAMALTTQDEAERYVRFIVDQFSNRRISATWEGEWQPGIDIGTECALIGMIEEGGEMVPISYGAFRITEMEVEITHDADDMSWTWHGSYTGEYLGAASYIDAESLEVAE